MDEMTATRQVSGEGSGSLSDGWTESATVLNKQRLETALRNIFEGNCFSGGGIRL